MLDHQIFALLDLIMNNNDVSDLTLVDNRANPVRITQARKILIHSMPSYSVKPTQL